MTSYRNQSLERGFAILEYLGNATEGRAVSDIARATGLHRATAHRLLEVLSDLGYVHKSADRRYWIGYSMHVFGDRASMITRIAHHARPTLVALANEVGETVNLGALEGIQAYVADRVTVDRSMRSDAQVGGYLDAHATAIGKALLALRPADAVRDSYRDAPLRAHTARTITDVPTLLRVLAEVRARGYAVSNEERSAGVRSVAAALKNPHGRAACAIAVTGPRARMDEARIERLGARLQEVAAGIVARMLTTE